MKKKREGIVHKWKNIVKLKAHLQIEVGLNSLKIFCVVSFSWVFFNLNSSFSKQLIWTSQAFPNWRQTSDIFYFHPTLFMCSQRSSLWQPQHSDNITVQYWECHSELFITTNWQKALLIGRVWGCPHPPFPKSSLSFYKQ